MLRITVHRPINSFSIPVRILGGTVILGIVGIIYENTHNWSVFGAGEIRLLRLASCE